MLNGSGANVLGLSLLLRRHGAVVCAESAHINTDECGAPERLIGTKLLLLPAADGEDRPELIAEQLSGRGDDRRSQPGVVAVARSIRSSRHLLHPRRTAEDRRLLSRRATFALYLDGARLADAAAGLECYAARNWPSARICSASAAPRTGAIGAEALIVMRSGLARPDAPCLRQQQAQLRLRVVRFVAAQFNALLHDDLWRANATHANAMARRLAEGAAAVDGVEIVHPVQANAVFARLHPRHIAALQRDWTLHVLGRAL